MSIEERFELVTRNTAEVITREELRSMLETTAKPRAYWGFELSGLVHVGMGLICGGKIKDMVEAGFEFIVFLADWHSWINDKLGGKMENIRVAGEYFKHCFKALGIENVEYRWASDLVSDSEYWRKVIQIAKKASLRRVRRALPIMGRSMSFVDVEAAWMYYPCMQVADIFHMELDVACAGLDQRKAHMLVREAAEKLGWKKPVCIHTPLLMGLTGPGKAIEGRFDEDAMINLQISTKMSKSIPTGCIFVHDSPEEIGRKMRRAYCPPREVKNNPVIQLAKYVTFAWKKELTIERPEKYGGPVSYESYEELEKDYREGRLHPLDLKTGVSESIIEILEPVRRYFESNPEPLERMRKIEVTRSPASQHPPS